MAMAASLGQKGPQSSSNQRYVVTSCTIISKCYGHSGASGYDEDEALARAVAASLQEEEKKKHKRQSQQQAQQQPQRHQQQVNQLNAINYISYYSYYCVFLFRENLMILVQFHD